MDIISNSFSKKIQIVENISKILNISFDISYILLLDSNFNEEEVLISFQQNSKEYLEKLNLIYSEEKLYKIIEEKGECEICYNECLSNELIELPCKHKYCKNCWKDHIENKIDSKDLFIKCMCDKCKQYIPYNLINYLIENQEIKNKYQNNLVNQLCLVGGKDFYCKHPGCEEIITIENSKPNSFLICKCGFRLCTKCKLNSHHPLPCEFSKKWNELNENEFKENKLNNNCLKYYPNYFNTQKDNIIWTNIKYLKYLFKDENLINNISLLLYYSQIFIYNSFGFIYFINNDELLIKIKNFEILINQFENLIKEHKDLEKIFAFYNIIKLKLEQLNLLFSFKISELKF